MSKRTSVRIPDEIYAKLVQRATSERRTVSNLIVSLLADATENNMDEKPNSELTPQEVIAMPEDEFERRFGFRPVDALEKKWFAVTTKRLDSLSRGAIEAGLLDLD
jgi:hypothetical protein